MKNELQEEHRLFVPKAGEDMRVTYPELAFYPEFRNLRETELKFCWAIGSPSSQFQASAYSSPQRWRIDAIQWAFGERISAPERVDLTNGKFKAEIKDAIKKFGSFRLMHRVVAAKTLQHAFDNIQKILTVDLDDIPDMDDRKRYLEMVFDANKQMPSLLASLEHGFGVKAASKEEIEKAQSVSLVDKISDRTGNNPRNP